MNFPLLKESDIEVRVGSVAKSGNSLTLLLYKDARVDMRLLDETVGCDCWQCKYYRLGDSLFCSVGIHISGEWVWKDDCGTESNMEAKKGEASDAFKRACFRWGIGRELYTAPEIRVPAGLVDIKEGNKCYDRFEVTELTYEDGRIKDLTIYNKSKEKICWSTHKNGAKDPLYKDVIERMGIEAGLRGITVKELSEEFARKLGKEIDGTSHADMVWCLLELEGRNRND